jgi:hypothetical protein
MAQIGFDMTTLVSKGDLFPHLAYRVPAICLKSSNMTPNFWAM